MLQINIDETFKELSNLIGIEDDILIVGYGNNGTDNDKTLFKVLQICSKENLKLNKSKWHFRCSSGPFLTKLFLGKAGNEI